MTPPALTSKSGSTLIPRSFSISSAWGVTGWFAASTTTLAMTLDTLPV